VSAFHVIFNAGEIRRGRAPSWGNKIFLAVSDEAVSRICAGCDSQIATTGMVALSYVHKVSEKVSVFHVIFNAYIFFHFYSSFIT